MEFILFIWMEQYILMNIQSHSSLHKVAVNVLDLALD